MEHNSKEEKASTTSFYYYTVDAIPLYQSSKRPFHLENRLKKRRSLSFMSSNDQKNSSSSHEKSNKREAILEERRKKLNEHSLKVQKIAKEQEDRIQRKNFLLSKSMELAELNRNLYIEQRKAQSKKSVERAKRIALQNQHRSLQEQERRRAELEKRLERTEERRLAYLNKYQKSKNKMMTTSSCLIQTTTSSTITDTTMLTSSTKKADISTATATTTSSSSSSLSPSITALPPPKKKPSSWSIILKAFRELGLPSPSDTNTWLEFNTLSQLLHEAKVIVVTTKVLNTALKIKDEESKHRARILLTSYMMLICPKEVLQNVHGIEEKLHLERLHSAAKDMLHLFEIWLSTHGHPGATKARVRFVDAWNNYNILFETWKSKDCEQLTSHMIQYYLELSTLRQTVIAQNDGEQVGDQLHQQLDEIKHKLEKIGGTHALERLQRAMEASSSFKSMNQQQQESSNSSSRSTPRSPTTFDGMEYHCELQEDTNPDEQLAELLGNHLQYDFFTNEQLAHELIVDPEFKFKRYEPTSDLERRVKMMAERAFFDKLVEEIEQGKSDKSIISFIKEIKMRLLSLVRSDTTLYHKINDTLDMIEQQTKQTTFDLQAMIDSILHVMSKLCAPVRDEEIKSVQNDSNGNMIEQFKRIFDILEDMTLDLANFRLRSLRPHLMSIAVEYERDKFAKMLMDGTIQLVRTKSWLTQSTHKLCQVAAERDGGGDGIEQPTSNYRPSFDAIFEEAFISLIHQPEKNLVSAEDLPETLRLDIKRMAYFQNQLKTISIVAALLMLARNFGSTYPPSPHQTGSLGALSKRLFIMLEDDATTMDNLVAEIEGRVKVKGEQREMIRTMVEKTISHHDTVYSLLSRRVASVIKSTIQNNKFVTDAVLSSNGLEYVRDQLEMTSIQIQRLVYHHKKVYSPWYHSIMKEALYGNI
ncbi:T-complex protein 11-domain-containing protein [Cokeromyces recurvatus]|uniref:T-complex protein 11-domain-containing protein n=1 Tax=Cokeromyces recurvatus TaxID=90255 RepID=UPI00221E50C2|nr:T-complex protein 11-domain-containing protein [Cokeromyces recurvatus]KAI7900027.1 T-complex protein 11-domain-containing protein [Cokeromyces recurvatus]